MNKDCEDYYVGLDMGTNSVGWAVTDERYHLLRKKGKDLWGSRLFDRAETSADRRSHRVARRRLARQKARIGFLKEMFRPYIEKVDSSFLQRLEDSKFHKEDKTEEQPFTLFNDEGFTDRDYLIKYPTIFHLRKELLESTEEHDVRLVFLAILNMYKHRGHFLNATLKEGEIGDINDLMLHLNECLNEECEGWEWDICQSIDEQQNKLVAKKLSRSEKLEGLLGIFNAKKTDKGKKPLVEVYKFLCGLKGDLSAVFPGEYSDDESSTLKFSFSESKYSDNEAVIEGILGEDRFDAVLTMKQIYDWASLASIMRNDKGETFSYISQAKVALYEKHGAQLEIFKKLLKNEADEYNHMFRVMEKNTYSAYVGWLKYKGKKIQRGAEAKDFYVEAKKTLERINKEHGPLLECEELLADISSGNFLPKMLTTANSAIPNQVYATELSKILENASSYLPFLTEKDESGLTNAQKIHDMFTFHIPYYVGPLNKSKGPNAWVEWKEAGAVYPWNINEKIDMAKTSENFILNLVRKCTYLDDKKVMPENSLLNEEYLVLNELNNLKVKGQGISVELKKDLFNTLFKATGKRVTTNKLLAELKRRGILRENDGKECLQGYDKEKGGFINSLSNYRKFAAIFGVDVLTDSQIEVAEEAIRCATIYGDDKKRLEAVINEKFTNDELTPAQMSRVIGMRFKGWSRFSKEFLQLKGKNVETGDAVTVMSCLWNTNDNLMEIINSDKYTFREAIKERAERLDKTLSEVTFEDIGDSYMSAPVKRMVWQAIKVLQEIAEVMGKEPKRVFVEMSRYDDEKGDGGRTVSRKDALKNLYKKCKDDESKRLLSEIEARSERDFQNNKLYLYYRQKGKCLYSRNSIDVNKLFDDSCYDIDHIYPRHYVKDDSIENNRVLVNKQDNNTKDDMLLMNYIRSRGDDAKKIGELLNMWKRLHEEGFINDEKYARLTREKPFTDEEFACFIARQIVETRQGTKEAARILNEVLGSNGENNKVVYVKAKNVSDFRNSNKKVKGVEFPQFVKCRALNNHHHAKDAYLNIVVGNTYYTKFTLHPANFIKECREKRGEEWGKEYHLSKVFERRVERNGYVAWEPSIDLETVRNVLEKNSVLVTKRSYVDHGEISKQNVRPAKEVKTDGYIPIKSADERFLSFEGMKKYGGYTSVKGAYFFLVEHEEGKKRTRTIKPLYVMMASSVKNKEELEEYCRDEFGLKDPRVLVEKIPMYSRVRINGFDYYLTGRTGKYLRVCDAVQLILPFKYNPYIKVIAKAVKAIKEKVGDEDIASLGLSAEKNMELYEVLTEKCSKGIYSKRKGEIGDKLVKGVDAFENLSVKDQVSVLDRILKFSQMSSSGIDLELLGFKGKSVGVAKFPEDISKCKEFLLFRDSITGVYGRVENLLTIV